MSSFTKDIAGMLAGGVAGFASIEGMQQSIAAAESDIQATEKLEAVLRATGGAAGVTAEEISDLAGELQRVTKFEDDATVGAAAILATFKNIKNDNFKETLKLAQDFSALKGIGLNESVTLLGKALNNPAEGMTKLEKAGVSLNAEQEKLIRLHMAAGDAAGAQAVMLEALEESFGGVAEASTTTSEKLQNAAGDVMESFGKEILPVFELLSNVGIPALYGVSDAIANVGEQSALTQPVLSTLLNFVPGGQTVASLWITRDAIHELNDSTKEGKAEMKAMADASEEASAEMATDWTTFGEDFDAELNIDKEFKKRMTEMQDELAILRGEATKTSLELRDMIEGGLSSKETDQLQSLHDQIEAQKELAQAAREKSDAEEALNQQADAVRASVMTPEEKAAEKKAELQALLDAGKIDQETFDRATKQDGSKPGQEPAGAVGAQAKGSAEAMSSIFAAMRAKDLIPQKQLAVQEQLLQLQEETVGILRDGGLGVQLEVGSVV